MTSRIRFAAVSAAVLLAAATASRAELKEADAARLERAKTAQTSEIDKAAERYQMAVDAANAKLKAAYALLIGQYAKAGDKATADTLQAQLDELLAAPADGAGGGAAAAKTPRNLHRDLIAKIGPNLQTADGGRVDTAQLGSVSHVLLYFSASWCGPCKQFTPTLVEFYNEHAASKKVMVVLVGRDRSDADQRAYMKSFNMPFPAIPFNRLNPSGIPQQYGGRGIPNLVMLNPDGTVASGSYEGDRYVGPNKVLADLKKLLAEEVAAK